MVTLLAKKGVLAILEIDQTFTDFELRASIPSTRLEQTRSLPSFEATVQSAQHFLRNRQDLAKMFGVFTATKLEVSAKLVVVPLVTLDKDRYMTFTSPSGDVALHQPQRSHCHFIDTKLVLYSQQGLLQWHSIDFNTGRVTTWLPDLDHLDSKHVREYLERRFHQAYRETRGHCAPISPS